ncbi:histidinol dehydrogenase [Demequina sp. SYSU T00039]|uniref:Histidinol dehydrogenase n=1 Tax=Demequina lignilytica TaxID=3051663 RepID=A0AAW7M8D6_9MICO|nr:MULTISPECIES: histidinol dehydrogenase [unclassified Demequina]MDN4477098.1 histidinol dehydrogenase [Demequina sp. SYSU T00039-1]MDN4487271.1 histidinol dehydrogenase [Demequina sp. SYSU T00039]MDN4491522.1 histidinol dehydrogenase [Demequina sp. SYSU T00068]
MLNRIDLRGQDLTARELLSIVPRADVNVGDALAVVEPIIEDVRTRGADALRELGARFDGVTPEHLRVPVGRIEAALETLDDAVRAGLEEAIHRVRTFHVATVPPPVSVELAPGATVSQRWVPVGRVGLYVPGGLAVYPSSVVMNVVTAQAAGVPSIAVASPPQKEFGGLPHPTILAACALLGVDEVYAVGGAQAVAMLALGADGLCDPVDVITGPGNVYVAAAKRAVTGLVGIDSEAGPTEIAVIADAQADARFVAADLLSQAEHDPMAGSVLITDSEELADKVDVELAALASATKHSERAHTALGGRQSAIILTDDVDQSVAVADAYGAEHLEIQTEDAHEVAGRIRNAGAIFIGAFSPVPLGDYLAGSNHVLPTGGTARFASGLNVTSFLKAVSYIDYGAYALGAVGDKVVALADAEDLPAHGEAIRARLEES